MKWLVKTPNLGAVRVKRKFAWLPVLLSDKHTKIWLEFYTETEHYLNSNHIHWLNGTTTTGLRWVVCKREQIPFSLPS
jgi:hypothetical protein